MLPNCKFWIKNCVAWSLAYLPSPVHRVWSSLDSQSQSSQYHVYCQIILLFHMISLSCIPYNFYQLNIMAVLSILMLNLSIELNVQISLRLEPVNKDWIGWTIPFLMDSAFMILKLKSCPQGWWDVQQMDSSQKPSETQSLCWSFRCTVLRQGKGEHYSMFNAHWITYMAGL